MTDPIAIVGMACEYPDARSPEQLWENVLAQRQAFRPLPPERLRVDEYPADDLRLGLGSYSGQAAVLEGYAFDRQRFRISGPAYRAVDLSHWLALDCAERALRDGGFPAGQDLPSTSTAVLLGNTLTGDYSRAASLQLRWPYVLSSVTQGLAACGLTPDTHPNLLPSIRSAFLAPLPDLNAETLAGWLSNTIAGRICNYFDLKGGGYVVDGACASSLLAVASGCSALAAGDIDVAIVGGVDLSIDPFELVGFARAGALATEDMRPYDRRAAGFWPGEGCGIVVLMRAADARDQKRTPYALLRGWGVSSDGHGGITRPELEGQLHAIRRAYCRAGLTTDAVSLFEGHGTGTTAGDEVELQALTTALAEAGAAVGSAAIGSVKANIGHTKAAAGVAGLIKAVMAIHHGVLPPATGCAQPRESLTGSGLRVLHAPEPWPSDRPRRAGVSAMGFGGINVHVVLEGASAPRARRVESPGQLDRVTTQDAEILPLAAANVHDLKDQLSRIVDWLQLASRAELGDLALHFQHDPGSGPLRAALVARTPSAMRDRCETMRRELDQVTSLVDTSRGLYVSSRNNPVVGLLCSGQGSPKRPGGGRWGIRFPEVRELYVGRNAATRSGQESIVLASLAALHVLARCGLRAQLAIGHSLGELTALHWANAIDERTLLEVVRQRASAMERYGGRDGAMAVVVADAGAVRELIAPDEAVVVACLNGPTQTVISGDRPAVDRALARARERGIDGQAIPVPQAFHSSHMAPVVVPFARVLEETPFGIPHRPVYSTVLGRLLRPTDDLRDLLRAQLTAPVRFAECVEATPRVDLWIEVGPGDVLARMVREQFCQPAISLDACGDSFESWLHAIAAAYALGAPVDWEGVAGGRFSRPIDLGRRRQFLSSPCSGVPRADPRIAEAREEPKPAPVESVLPTTGPSREPLTIARQLIADRAELPVESISPGHRLLSDLHLNSMTVGLIAADLSRTLGLGAASFNPSLTDATVAGLVEGLVAGGEARRLEDRLAGVAPWVRPFRVEYRPAPLGPVRAPTSQPGVVSVWGDTHHPYREAATSALKRAGGGTLVCLPADPDADALMPLFNAGRSAAQDREAVTFVVIHRNGGGRGFCRTLSLEAPRHRVLLVDVSDGHPDPERALFEEISRTAAFREVRIDADDRRYSPVLVPAQASPEVCELSSGDVVLVTGGTGGITAECGIALARAAGCRLAVVGRSAPSAVAVRAFLERCDVSRIAARYEAADVRDERALASAVDRLTSDLGPITVVVHGAGVNNPCLLHELDDDRIRATVETKLAGAGNLLSTIDRSSLRGFVAFGSAIAHTGLAGEAHYAAANELLSLFVNRTSRQLPHCRCLTIDWSVWSGAGMAERLNRVATLEQSGVTPIPIDRGVELFLQLVTRPHSCNNIIVSGRLGQAAPWALSDVTLRRFVERTRVHVPEVEILADADISPGSDPYLSDHCLNGSPLMPAVMSLEAMAQAAQRLLPHSDAQSVELRNVRFERPIAIAGDRLSTIRTAGLASGDGVAVVVRCAETDFRVDHATATYLRKPAAAPPAPFPIADRSTGVIDATAFYGSMLFQGPRFQRVRGYRLLHARHAIAELDAAAPDRWFGAYQPQALVLGDPGVRDAAIHAIQACIPDRRIVPTGVDVLWTSPSASGTRVVHGVERSQSGAMFLYDLIVTDDDGVCEVWQGLRLQAIAPLTPTDGWPVALLGPLLERTIQDGTDVRVLAAECDDRPGAGRALIRRLQNRPVTRRPDGRPETADGYVSAAHASGVGIAIAASTPIACDIEPVCARSRDTWNYLLGDVASALDGFVLDGFARDGDQLNGAATRLWCVRECLLKLGLAAPVTLGLRERDDDTIVFRACDADVITRRVRVNTGAELILAVTRGHAGATPVYQRTHGASAVQSMS